MSQETQKTAPHAGVPIRPFLGALATIAAGQGAGYLLGAHSAKILQRFPNHALAKMTPTQRKQYGMLLLGNLAAVGSLAALGQSHAVHAHLAQARDAKETAKT